MSAFNRSLWFGNAAANVAGGVVAAAVGVILPAILTRSLTVHDFTLWSLAFPIVNYVQVISSGLLSSVSRYIAASRSSENDAAVVESILIGKYVLKYAVLISSGMVLVYGGFYPLIVSELSGEDLKKFVFLVFIFGVGAVVQSSSLLLGGVFVGHQRNILWILSQGVSRLLTIFFVFFASLVSGWVFTFAAIYSLLSTTVVPISWAVFKRNFIELAQLALRFPLFSKSKAKEVLNHYLIFTSLSFSALIVSAASVAIVGVYEYSKVGAFSLAMTLVGVFVGVLQAGLAPLVPFYIKEKSKENIGGAVQLCFNATSLVAGILFLVIIVYLVAGEYFLRAWIGGEYFHDVAPILGVLLVAHSMRNLSLPFSMLMLGLTRPSLSVWPAVAEAVTYLGCSFFTGPKFGSMGICVSAGVGAAVLLIANFILFRANFAGVDVTLGRKSKLIFIGAVSLCGLAFAYTLRLSLFLD